MTPYKGFHRDAEFEPMPKIATADAHALIDEYRRDQAANRVNLETLGRAGWREKGHPPISGPPRLSWASTVSETLRRCGFFPALYEVTVYHDAPRPFGRERAQPVVTVCVVRERHGSRTYIGVARCAAGDQFSRRHGRGLALMRAVQKIIHTKGTPK